MATVGELVVAFAPRFTGDARIAVFTDLAAQALTPSAWGAVYAQALALMVCHMLTIYPPDVDADTSAVDAAGPATSKTTGDVSITYGASAVTVEVDQEDAELMRTAYGRRFLALRNARPGATARLIQPGA